MNKRLANPRAVMTTIRELAHRSAAGMDVSLMWDSETDEAFVVVIDEMHDEHFLVSVDDGNALDVFHHPYAYAGKVGLTRRAVAREALA